VYLAVGLDTPAGTTTRFEQTSRHRGQQLPPHQGKVKIFLPNEPWCAHWPPATATGEQVALL
jgi:hypothetical protein